MAVDINPLAYPKGVVWEWVESRKPLVKGTLKDERVSQRDKFGER